MRKPINNNEKPFNKRLDNRRKNEIKKLLSERYSIGKNKKIVDFISLYIECEVTAMKFVQYYKSDKKKKSSDAYEPLNYQEIVKASQYFGLDIGENYIENIFKSSTGIRNYKTPRQLRNAIIHTKSVKDIEEVEIRFKDLRNVMKKWLDKTIESIHKF